MARQGAVKVEVTVLPALVQVLHAERGVLKLRAERGVLKLALERGACEAMRLRFLAEQQELINAMERRVSRLRKQRDQLLRQLRAQKEDPMTTQTPATPILDFKRCPTCKEMDVLPRHRCPPAWQVWEEGEETEAEARTIYATRPDTAAEGWAKEYDRAAGDEIADGETVTVVVKATDGTLTRWRVSGEMVPQYSASPALSLPPPTETSTSN